ncbi:MAG: glycosyltransferase family 39 protein [Gemmatimonadota bacterium]|nr:glycosyltransferase family 39 protein [Gemmatimonadota bacterium]
MDDGNRDEVGRVADRAPGGVGATFLKAAGWLLLLVPFIPLRAIFDDPPGTTWLIPPGEWLLGLTVFLTIGGLAAWMFPDLVERAASGVTTALRRPGDRAFRFGALALLAVILVVASTFAFSRSPLLIDSIIQLFQGKIFAAGLASADAPAYEGFFTTQHMLVDGGRWYSQYPPGHPAALALGVWIGAPWLIPIVFSLITAWLIADTARRLFGEDVSRASLILMILAPFFWFMGASYMNHVSAVLFVGLFLWSVVRWEQSAEGGEAPRAGWILLGGLALGTAFLSRPLTSAAVGAALIFPAIRIAGRRWLSHGIIASAGFAATASMYFVFNAVTTGHPLTAGYVKLWGESHGLGFHRSPWGDSHTPLTGLRNELIDLGLLHSFLFEWAIPALLPLGAFLALGWATRKWEGRLVAAFFAIPAAYFFYWHRDAFLGPRYLYEGLPFLVPLLAVSFIELRRRSNRPVAWLRGLNASTLLVAVVGLSFVYSVFYATPQRFRVYATGMESVKRDLVLEAEAAGIDEGLIFVAVSWGNRIIARARGAGASASVAERVYRSSDHCELELVVRSGEAQGWSAERLNQEMLGLIRPEDEIEVVRLNDDPTLRLVPNRPLAEPCAREVLYDREGYTNYSPHLAANTAGLDGRFVFARDLGDQNDRLREEYPGKPAYLYRDGTFFPLP